MPCTVLNNMSKCRALMDKTKANRFLHISPCLCAAGTTLPRGRSQEGNQKLKTQLIHIWLVSLWRRDLSTPVLWNKNSTYYRYLHYITLHYIALRCIALHCFTLHTYMHAYIHMFVSFCFCGEVQKNITHNLYRFVYTYLCAVSRKLHAFFWLGSGTHNVVVERVCDRNQSKTK